MFLFLNILFSTIGLLVGLSHCQCTDGSNQCGFLANGSGVICNYTYSLNPPRPSDGWPVVNTTLLLQNQTCPAAVSGHVYSACTDLDLGISESNITLYSCPAAVACYLPSGLTDGAKSNDTSCPSIQSLLASLGVYNVVSAAFSVILGKSIKHERNTQRGER